MTNETNRMEWDMNKGMNKGMGEGMNKEINKEINLVEWGLNEKIVSEHSADYSAYFLGRVVEEHKSIYKIMGSKGEVVGKISGKYAYEAFDRVDYPTVGDWVVMDRENDENGEAVIHGLMTRTSRFSRKIAGTRTDEQLIAANVDTLFICMSLNHDFNLKRLERYISIAWNSGVTPVIVLTKADLCENLDEKLNEVESVAMGIEIFTVSALEEIGMASLEKYIQVGKTISFVGSSGVGKSTLVNKLMGVENQETQSVGTADKGRHTTTYRKLMVMPGGGVLIDTPGMREIGMLADTNAIDESFGDIDGLAMMCKFSNCTHKGENGCAIHGAIEAGELSEERYANYLKLKREAVYLEKRAAKKKTAGKKAAGSKTSGKKKTGKRH